MENVLEKIFDFIAQDDIGCDKNSGKIYERIHKNYNSKDSEDELFCDIAELVYHEQLSAFKSGVKLSFKIFNEISA